MAGRGTVMNSGHEARDQYNSTIQIRRDSTRFPPTDRVFWVNLGVVRRMEIGLNGAFAPTQNEQNHSH